MAMHYQGGASAGTMADLAAKRAYDKCVARPEWPQEVADARAKRKAARKAAKQLARCRVVA